MAFQLPLTLTCKAIEPPANGGPMVLDCVAEDAAGVEVRARGNLRLNVNPKCSYEELCEVLQSTANNLAKDLLARGDAERAEVKEEDRMKQLDAVVDHSFYGVAK